MRKNVKATVKSTGRFAGTTSKCKPIQYWEKTVIIIMAIQKIITKIIFVKKNKNDILSFKK